MHAASTAQTPDQLAFPSGIVGLAVWYDAADAATVTDAGAGAVSAWADKSGNLRHLTQATSANRPKTKTRWLNGLNVIDFDGSNDNLVSNAWTLAQPLTYFVVGALDLAANRIGIDRGASGTPGGPILQRNAANAWELFAGTSLIGPAANTAPHLFACVVDGATSRFRVDGAETVGNSGTQSFSSGGIRVGSSRTPSLYWDGYIAEVAVYAGALSVPDVASMEAYLFAKWFA